MGYAGATQAAYGYVAQTAHAATAVTGQMLGAAGHKAGQVSHRHCLCADLILTTCMHYGTIELHLHLVQAAR